jgi:hypothetical protein
LLFELLLRDILYGEHSKFKEVLENRATPYVVLLKPSHAWWDRVGRSVG